MLYVLLTNVYPASGMYDYYRSNRRANWQGQAQQIDKEYHGNEHNRKMEEAAERRMMKKNEHHQTSNFKFTLDDY